MRTAMLLVAVGQTTVTVAAAWSCWPPGAGRLASAACPATAWRSSA
jgi:hypothetical protein